MMAFACNRSIEVLNQFLTAGHVNRSYVHRSHLQRIAWMNLGQPDTWSKNSWTEFAASLLSEPCCTERNSEARESQTCQGQKKGDGSVSSSPLLLHLQTLWRDCHSLVRIYCTTTPGSALWQSDDHHAVHTAVLKDKQTQTTGCSTSKRWHGKGTELSCKVIMKLVTCVSCVATSCWPSSLQ